MTNTTTASRPSANDAASPWQDLYRQRYGGADLPAAPTLWNDTLSTLLGHRSVRSFLSKPLPPGTLETLVAAAQSASTSSNFQFWSVIAVEDPARKARIAALAAGQKHIEKCPLLLVWLADTARMRMIADDAGKQLEAIDYLESSLVAIIDTALAAQNAVVALESLGLGSVYIGAMRNHPEEIAAELGLPPHIMAVFGLCVGYPDPAIETSIKPRLGQDAVLHRDQYDPSRQVEAAKRYNAANGSFRAGQNMSGLDWTDQMMARLGSLKAMHGRDRLREALKNLGFPLR